jgi:hypothetical protein
MDPMTATIVKFTTIGKDLTWPNGELNQQGGPQNVRGSDLIMLFGLMI